MPQYAIKSQRWNICQVVPKPDSLIQSIHILLYSYCLSTVVWFVCILFCLFSTTSWFIHICMCLHLFLIMFNRSHMHVSVCVCLCVFLQFDTNTTSVYSYNRTASALATQPHFSYGTRVTHDTVRRVFNMNICVKRGWNILYLKHFLNKETNIYC